MRKVIVLEHITLDGVILTDVTDDAAINQDIVNCLMPGFDCS